MAELPSGSAVAGCRIEGVVGRGGMGVVYRATQVSLERTVALKVIAGTPRGGELPPDEDPKDGSVEQEGEQRPADEVPA